MHCVSVAVMSQDVQASINYATNLQKDKSLNDNPRAHDNSGGKLVPATAYTPDLQ